MTEITARREKEKAKYEATAADLSKAVSSLEGDFAFHGDDIIATLQDLEKEFKAKKAEVDQIEGQNKKDFNEVMKSKTNEKKTAEDDKKTAEGDKDTADE